MRFATYAQGGGPARAGVVGDDPPPLRPGDVVELAVEGIGTVRNRVVEGRTLPPVREARTRSVPRVRKRG
jgi:hypothetical protein